VLRATTASTFSTSELPKVVRQWCVLYILTSKRASRHNGVHFFDIATSKSGPAMVCFVHFDFEMCFAPQRRALFQHLNCQKWSAPLVFCTFWLGKLRGDWEFHKMVWNFQACGWNAINVCFRCPARSKSNDSGFLYWNCAEDSAWQQGTFSTAQFIAQRLPQKHVCGLISSLEALSLSLVVL